MAELLLNAQTFSALSFAFHLSGRMMMMRREIRKSHAGELKLSQQKRLSVEKCFCAGQRRG
jgi:hypothetical protein